MNYPVIEIFYSLQGEGAHVGTPAIFLRLAGCNLSCEFCDTPSRNTAIRGEMTLDEIVAEIITKTADLTGLVIITGGEPTIHDLNPLVSALTDLGYMIVIETNGTTNQFPLINRDFVHYSVSPKPHMDPLPEMIIIAGSVKLLCDMNTTADDINAQIETIIGHSGSISAPEIFLQPVVNDHAYMSNDSIHHTVKLSLATGIPLSLQIHKLLGVS